MSHGTYGHNFEIEDTATTSEVRYHWNNGITYTGAEFGNPRPRQATLSNDGAVDLLFRLTGAAGDQHTLKPGETITMEVISDVLWVVTGSSTAAFRAFGVG